ncbi:non-heme iron oxygenase ferredoxin subunit [Actinoalloteichus hymeniacidonis]|uniref:Ferredoxin subunit of nitrite reductase and ring-hydroxylating dioxygenase n=1 Tax=Actinoalloteichus hymeniacidonis TaxID=340345 RepID=A0AAC9HPH5_9PSEU|nr:non-heme iron oxygenase ferredoxin subunit [Actinoalloteichus hymeniacidonis]AOS63177.1 ferredoxin subunit of nitrite reductase and ring-hydroxylating dioxygenase [Actinoalloteichus hymeniacidonis]MBB5908786.1 3-phenylpropionate/trans-cinnamate dioxygenase ferredoxin subunit [Actinoalloteichus hymeniacidonis]
MTMTPVCEVDELPEGKPVRHDVDGVSVVLVRDAHGVHALHDVCSHAEVALSEGDLVTKGGKLMLECWLHGSCFDLRTGAPTGLPATDPVAVFATEISQGWVRVDPARRIAG